MRAADMIRTVAFGAGAIEPVAKERYIREKINAAGRAREVGLDCKVGTAAKKLLLADKPQYVFPKKSVYCNGQAMEANRWLESQKVYIERALATM